MSASSIDPTLPPRIVFFDGICGLCNTSVDFLMPRDHNDRLHFATLQGETAEQLLSPEQLSDLDTILYYREGKVLDRSTAVLTILKDMGGPWSVLRVALILPRSLRDAVYKIVADNRYRWFGKKESCRMPTPKERGKIMD